MTAKLLVAAIAITLSGLVGAEECQNGSCIKHYGEWSVEETDSSNHATTISKTGGMLSYMCMANEPGCQWAAVMPEADCKPGSSVAVSIKGDGTVLIVGALCNSLPNIGDMPGAGRVLVLDKRANRLISEAISTHDMTISTQGPNGKVVRHRFSSDGAGNAVSYAIASLPHGAKP